MYQTLRPLLFALEPEQAHRATFAALHAAQRLGLLHRLCPSPVADPTTVMGLRFANRVGLAAGLDKNAEHLDVLGPMGFGFIEVGTVTPKPQAGNPSPRMFRLPQAQAIINRMGFNNQGVETLLKNIQRSQYTGVLGINIGKNASTPLEEAHQDYLSALRAVYPYASYIAVNISSPNTKNLRDLQGGDHLDLLLGSLKAEQARLADEHGQYKPMALKIAPDLDAAQVQAIAQRVLHYKLDAVIATNTTLDRSGLEPLMAGVHHSQKHSQNHSHEAGGLSGKPLTQRATAMVAALYQHLGEAVPIIGVGGIGSGADAVEKIRAGAKLVQVYTGLIYQGPALVEECAATVAANCKKYGPGKLYP